MNWKIKAHILAVLSRCPFGPAIYHRMQKAMRTNRLDFDESLRRVVELLDLVCQAGANLKGKHVVEIGSGWRPFIPFVLRLAGAERIVTLDVHPWMDGDYVRETYEVLDRRIDDVGVALGISSREIRSRFPRLSSNKIDWQEVLAAFHVDYRFPGDATNTALPEGSVDVILSSNVLEHIPLDVLEQIHRESIRILKPSGLSVHRFNPEDHFASVDRAITRANFLQFSERKWKWLGGSGLAFHNRLRCRQHYELFQGSGLDIVFHRVRQDPHAYEAVISGDLPIHADFSSFSVEELTADYMWIAAKKPEGEAELYDYSSRELSSVD